MEYGKYEITDVEYYGIKQAINGMRRSYNSQKQSDTEYLCNCINIGKKDLGLMKGLLKSGSERKFLRQIQVWFDMKMPRYFWEHWETYLFENDLKHYTTSLSDSTMHNLTKRPLTIEDFVFDNDFKITETTNHYVFLYGDLCHKKEWQISVYSIFSRHIEYINELLERYKIYETKQMKKELERTIFQLLPQSYLQTRSINTNLETIYRMCRDRSKHKLNEWHYFIDTMVENLPLLKKLLEENK